MVTLAPVFCTPQRKRAYIQITTSGERIRLTSGAVGPCLKSQTNALAGAEAMRLCRVKCEKELASLISLPASHPRFQEIEDQQAKDAAENNEGAADEEVDDKADKSEGEEEEEEEEGEEGKGKGKGKEVAGKQDTGRKKKYKKRKPRYKR